MRLEKYIEEGLGSFRKAYFISPTGKVIDCEISHINKVIADPKMFGYTKEKIEKIYDKHNEPIGHEGKAREEIILDLIKKGWIRLRKYKNFWAVNINKMTKKVKDHLQDWAEKIQTNLLGYKERDKFIPVKIQGSNYRDEFELNKIANDILYSANESKEERERLIIEDENEI